MLNHKANLITGGPVSFGKAFVKEVLKRYLNTKRYHKKCRFNARNHGGWYYEMQTLGYNYRLTDLQARIRALAIETGR